MAVAMDSQQDGRHSLMKPQVTMPSSVATRPKNSQRSLQGKSSISQARHFMGMANNLSDEVKAQAEEYISTIENLLEADDNTKAESTAKLSNLLES